MVVKSYTFTAPKQASDCNRRVLAASHPVARWGASWSLVHHLPARLASRSSHPLPVAAKTSRLPLQLPADSEREKKS